jgi:hypothetical protein
MHGVEKVPRAIRVHDADREARAVNFDRNARVSGESGAVGLVEN